MKPDEKLIDSMSMRYRHDFGFLDEQTKNAIRTTMRQVWEEVVGLGFYKHEEIQPTWDDVRKAIEIDRQRWIKENEVFEIDSIDKIINQLKKEKQ